jgi:DNA-binding transcriptional LysR family regulator
LRTFVAVAATLNITRAARKVHLTQSSVTEQIQTLEADLGARLFDRTQRGLRLTAAGQRLLDHAVPLLAMAEEAKAAVADTVGEPKGAKKAS